jgi:long-subunit acyl-CoA synthetase (AMP-forming)
MKRAIAIVLVCLCCVAGCAAFKTDVAKVETKVESINWSEVLTYWQSFENGLLEALPVVGALFPNNSQTIAKITQATTDANTAVTALASTVTAVQAGTATTASATAAAKTVETSVVAASNLIGSAIASAQPATAK